MEEEKRPPSASKKMGLMNDELLRPVQKTEETKRNTKEFLIDRILSVAEENNLELSISNSKLKRMSKERLQKMLGEMLEEVVKSEMAAAVGAKSGDDSVIACYSEDDARHVRQWSRAGAERIATPLRLRSRRVLKCVEGADDE